MSQYNIEMNSYDGSQYNQLYPQTLLNNVTDWSNILYTKNEINNIFTNKQTFSLLTTINCSSYQNSIILPNNIGNYLMLWINVESIRGSRNSIAQFFYGPDSLFRIGVIGSGGGAVYGNIFMFINKDIGIASFSEGGSGSTAENSVILNYRNLVNNSTNIIVANYASYGTNVTSGVIRIYGVLST